MNPVSTSHVPPYPVVVRYGDIVQTMDGYGIVKDIDGPDCVCRVSATNGTRVMATATIQIPEAFEELFVKGVDKVYWGGRGGAKSWAVVDAALIRGQMEKLRFMCGREIQNSIEDSIYQLLVDRIDAHDLRSFYTVQKTRIIGRNGTTFVFKGLRHNPDGMKSFEGIDICIVEEAQRVSADSWSKLIPTVRKDGSEIWVVFNPSTEDDPTYQEWVVHPPAGTIVKKVSYRDNPFESEKLKQRRLHLKATDPEAYDFIYEGNFNNKVIGAYFAEQMNTAEKEGRICNVPYEPTLPVYTSWDLGMNDELDIWFFQIVGKEVRAIDFFASSDHGLDFYAKILKERPYAYEEHLLPHDVEVRELSDGKTRKETLEGLGIKPVRTVSRVPNQAEGIQAVRAFLPRVWIEKTKCADGVKALKNYHREWDDKRQVFIEYPAHDWASHPTKAFETFARGFQEKVKASAPRPDPRDDARNYVEGHYIGP